MLRDQLTHTSERGGECDRQGSRGKRERTASARGRGRWRVPRGRRGPAHEGRRVGSPHPSGAEQRGGARHFSGANWKAGERVRRASASYHPVPYFGCPACGAEAVMRPGKAEGGLHISLSASLLVLARPGVAAFGGRAQSSLSQLAHRTHPRSKSPDLLIFGNQDVVSRQLSIVSLLSHR
ncbi:hypothetical protein BHM03_00002827 [Ensete ventricosum]|nr:hypothetical protein BHM03_00002827 [Ensete ventricosum]